MNEMNQSQALEILIKVALVAQAKGALTLEDAVVVKQAIDKFSQDGQQEESTLIEDGQAEE